MTKDKLCGGAIIDYGHVITSTYCLLTNDGKRIDPKEIKVHGGSLFVYSDKAGVDIRTAKQYFIHPVYDEQDPHGVAIIRVGKLTRSDK